MLANAVRSLVSFYRSVFGPSESATSTAGATPLASFNPDQDYNPSLKDVPRYPPFDRGLPFITVDDLIKSQQTLVDRIHEAELPYADEAVRNLAKYVHLLPATTNDFFCGAGGLFRLCLEIGFHSFIACQGNIFTSRDPAEKRRALDAKWQLAAFLAGLCCELSRTIVTSVVTNDQGEQWLPFEPITVWLHRTNSQRYFLRPPQASLMGTHDTDHLSGVIVNAIIPSEALQHITTDDRNILMQMLSTITRITDTYNSGQFPRAVRHIRDQVIQRDKISNPLTFGKALVGVHVEPYLINGMRHLVRNGTWKTNQKMARVHVGPDGAFLFWSTGVAEILAMLKEEGALGIPTDPRTLGELLMNSGVFEPNADGSLWWYIKTPISPTVYEVVKLSNPSIILDDDTLSTTTMYPEAIAIDPATAKALQSQASLSAGAAVDRKAVETGVAAGSLQTELHPAQASGALSASEGQVPVKASRDYSKALSISAKKTVDQPPEDARQETNRTKQPRRQKPPSEAQSTSHGVSQSTPASSTRPTSTPAAAPAQPVVRASQQDPIASILKRPSLITDMQLLRDLHNQSGTGSPMFWSEHGLAIPRLVLNTHVDYVTMTVALGEAQCLYVAPGQTTKLHTIDRDGKQLSCIVLLTQKALEFGFVREPEQDPTMVALTEQE